MTYLDHPDGPRGIQSQSPIRDVTKNFACEAYDCEFVGDVEATAFYQGTGPDGRVFRYLWTCPWCEMDQTDETTDADEADA